MNSATPFAPPFSRVVEHVDRRILGALQFVDAITQLPVIGPGTIEIESVRLASGAAVPFDKESIRVRQTRSGFWAITRAPYFDDYADTFDNPATPAKVENDSLQLRFGLRDAGPNYLPQEFQFDLPRTLNDRKIFQPLKVPLFRAPGAPAPGGWAILRVQVRTAQSEPLGGVLVNVFPHPRPANAAPIGRGMSDWRGRLRGEALVAVPDIPRFRAGDQPGAVLVTVQEIQFEIVRDTNFTAAADQLPDGAKLVAGTAGDITTLRSDAPVGPKLGVAPAVPLEIRAGQEIAIVLTPP